jgi:Flp pilus assembly protein TadB
MTFLVSMAYNFELTEPKTKANDKPKYPYIERIEVGYKIKPFESSDTIQYYAKKVKVEDKEEAEYEAKKQRIKESAAYAAAITFFFYVVCGASVGIILLIIGLILLLLARWQRNIAKKR